jgi:glycosyltransferase involved in cell wall biosynthesis
MKILLDLTSLADNFSGIERFALCIAKEMIKNREIQYILVFKNIIHPDFDYELDNVQKVVIKGKNKLIFNQFILPFKLYTLKADFYLFLAFPEPFFFFKKNAISAIHDVGCWDCPSKNKQWMTLYFRIMYRKCALGRKKIITVSEFSKKRIHVILKKQEKDIFVVYNGISKCFEPCGEMKNFEEESVVKYKLPKDYILCLSTLEPRKNLRLLIEAFTQLQNEKRLKCDLVLAGRKGWMMDDLLLGISEDILNKIHFTGFIDENLLPYVYKKARMFVFPSMYEGFGVPPIEAMYMGVPVVSSDAASLPEILKDGAVYFKNNDVENLKTRIIETLNSNDTELIQRGRKVSESYRWSTEGRKLIDIISRLY